MTLQNYVQRFTAMVDALQTHPEIKVTEFQVMPPASAEELAAAEAYHPLVPGMREFYSQANGIKLNWEYVGDRFHELGSPLGTVVEGHVDLLPIQQIMMDQEGMLYFGDDDPFKGLHPVDFYIPEACVAIRLDGSVQPKMYYHYCGEEMATLGMGFAEYLELLLESRGFFYWPKAIAEPEYFNEYTPVSFEEAAFRLIMPELFPGFNNGHFKSIDGRVPPISAIEALVSQGGGTADLSTYKYAQTLGSGTATAPSPMGTDLAAAPPTALALKPVPKKMMMFFLAFFFGNFGIHRYMMGYKNWWLMPLTCGFCGIWALYDAIMIVTGSMGMEDGTPLLE